MRKPKLRIFHDGTMEVSADMAIGATEGMPIPKDLVVMLSTDVLDTNGTEIFEGDIVERECGDILCADRHIGIVTYDYEEGCYIMNNPKLNLSWPMVAVVLGEDERRVVGHIKPKVLGNGYEDPKLYTLL